MEHVYEVDAPYGATEVASELLLPGNTMRRWTETVRVLEENRLFREIEIDLELPSETEGRWVVPTAHFSKWPVSPDLQCLDEAGSIIPIPSKAENMATTCVALQDLHQTGHINLDADPDLRELVKQVVYDESFGARVARKLIDDRLGNSEAKLRAILTRLEDQFLLWVPLRPKDSRDRHIKILRSHRDERDRLITDRRVPGTRLIETAVGTATVTYDAAGPKTFSPSVAWARVRQAFGLTTFVHGHPCDEAPRFASFHLKIHAPDGFAVRDTKFRQSVLSGHSVQGVQNGAGVTSQGRDTNLGHFHLELGTNPSNYSTVTSFGLLGGMTTFWAGAAVFTALLIWMVQHLAPANLSDAGGGSLEVVASTLLIGPTLAAAWAVRTDSWALEEVLIGARFALMFSAAVAVATAISLAGVRPFSLGPEDTLQVYSGLSYVVACLIAISWAVTLPVTWFLYRMALRTQRSRLVAIAAGLGSALLLLCHQQVPTWIQGLLLLVAGLSLAVIAAQPNPSLSSSVVRRGSVVATFGSIVWLLAAGALLGFYEDVIDASDVRITVLTVGAVLFGITVIQRFRPASSPS